MNLNDYLRVLRKRAALVIAAVVVCAGTALGASLTTRPVYQASAKLLVIARTNPKLGLSAYEGALLSQQLVKSFAEVLTSNKTAELALRLRPEALTASQLQR